MPGASGCGSGCAGARRRFRGGVVAVSNAVVGHGSNWRAFPHLRLSTQVTLVSRLIQIILGSTSTSFMPFEDWVGYLLEGNLLCNFNRGVI